MPKKSKDPRIKQIQDLLTEALQEEFVTYSDGSGEIERTNHDKVVEAAKLIKDMMNDSEKDA
jgi:hypothetical protein